MLSAVLAIGRLSQFGTLELGLGRWSPAVYGAVPTIETGASVRRAGRVSVQIQSDQPTDTALGRDVSLKAGGVYRLSAWIKTRSLNPLLSPVYAAIQAQIPGGAATLASGHNHRGDTGWTKDEIYFTAPPTGRVHLALFFCGWGRGTGSVWFDDVELQKVDVSAMPTKITKEPLCPGRISPMQYGQFIEYLCDLVPSMWAEKLYDTSFEGLSPYKFVYLKETDFKEKPWYPFGQTNRMVVDQDTSGSISGPSSKRIVLSEGATCEGGVAQDGVSIKKGAACRFSIYVKGKGSGSAMRVRLFRGSREFAAAMLPVGADWHKVSTALIPNATDANATLSMTFTGPGMFWLDSASLMPEDNVGGWRKDVVKALRELKPGVIRVGGSVMDDPNLGSFEWTDTVGDPDR